MPLYIAVPVLGFIVIIILSQLLPVYQNNKILKLLRTSDEYIYYLYPKYFEYIFERSLFDHVKNDAKSKNISATEQIEQIVRQHYGL